MTARRAFVEWALGWSLEDWSLPRVLARPGQLEPKFPRSRLMMEWEEFCYVSWRRPRSSLRWDWWQALSGHDKAMLKRVPANRLEAPRA